MDRLSKRMELAARRAVVRLFRIVGKRRGLTRVPLNPNGTRVLVLRHDRIGDVLITLPLIRILKRHFPSVRIDVLFGERNDFVATNESSIAHRYVFRKGPAATLALVLTLRRNHYDFVIDGMDKVSASATVLLSLIGAACSVGLQKENGFAYDVAVVRPSQSVVHVVDRLGELLRPFGIAPEREDLSLFYPLSETSTQRAQRWMDAFAPSARRIGVNMFAGGADKTWTETACVETIRQLRMDDAGASVILFASPADAARAAAVAEEAHAPVYPPGGFDDFAAGVAQCTSLITVDTSAVHLAAAFHIPAVVLFVQDDPALAPWTPYHSVYRAVTASSSAAHITSGEVLAAYASLNAELNLSPVTA